MHTQRESQAGPGEKTGDPGRFTVDRGLLIVPTTRPDDLKATVSITLLGGDGGY